MVMVCVCVYNGLWVTSTHDIPTLKIWWVLPLKCNCILFKFRINQLKSLFVNPLMITINGNLNNIVKICVRCLMIYLSDCAG